MPKSPSLVLLIALIAIAGCGGGDNGSSAETGGAPDNLLIGMENLPKGSAVGEAPPELCGPLPVLERDNGRTAISKMYLVGNARIVEAVGIFKTPEMAASAYNGLNTHKRLECIGNAIISLSSSPSVEVQQAEELDFGDEGTRVRYLVSGADSKSQGYTDVVSIRTGPCTASLLVAVEGENPSDEASDRASERAAESLDDGCG
ncbi:MAG: hypothetical protein QOF85_1343 [Solirubrobacterales bacterium]|jgi:hypothetical protein|nr:hypothetical protein [Solirubrobacterales bacterium]